MNPAEILNYVIICGVVAVAYGWLTSTQILNASAGNKTMQEIAKEYIRDGILSVEEYTRVLVVN